MSLIKVFVSLLLLHFLVLSFRSLPVSFHQKTPRDIVEIFMKTYAASHVSQCAHYTTPSFRNYKPKELWIIETWNTLSEYGYRHLSGTIIDEKIQDTIAIVTTASSIETYAGITHQRERYYLIKTEEGWKIDELLVEEEQLTTNKYRL